MSPFIALQQLWLQNLQMAAEAPQVIGQRLTLFSQPWWSANTVAEYQAMYWEKMAAMQEMCATWWLYWGSAQQQRQLLDVRRPYRYQQWLNDSVATANHSLFPFSRRVHANRQRLHRLS